MFVPHQLQLLIGTYVTLVPVGADKLLIMSFHIRASSSDFNCVPLLYASRYAREKLSVRESDRRRPPSVLNVFPSVEGTTTVNVCIQFAGFEQN